MMNRDISRIFVVDDEKVIGETLTTILQRCGYAASFFTNPLEALTRARSDTPDLLISDVVMPQLSGIDLAIRMKQLCPACRIMLISGQTGTRDLLLPAREQGHDFRLLSKPIYPTDLLREISHLGEVL